MISILIMMTISTGGERERASKRSLVYSHNALSFVLCCGCMQARPHFRVHFLLCDIGLNEKSLGDRGKGSLSLCFPQAKTIFIAFLSTNNMSMLLVTIGHLTEGYAFSAMSIRYKKK